MDERPAADIFAHLARDFARLHRGRGDGGEAAVIDFSDGEMTVTARCASYDSGLLQIDVTIGQLDLDIVPDLAATLLKTHHLNAQAGPRSGWFLTIDEENVLVLQKCRALSMMNAEVLTADITEALENADAVKAFWVDLVEGHPGIGVALKPDDHLIRI
jgi:hypothetical protein